MQPRLAPAGHRLGHPDQQGQSVWAGRRQGRQDPLLALDQGGPQQQVPGRVAPQRQLGGEQQVGAAGAGPLGGRQDPVAVALQVAHQGIELGQGEAHQGSERP